LLLNTTITPAKGFKGSIAKSNWLLNEDLAFIYRAYATYNRPLKITSPHNSSAQDLVWNAGSSVSIDADDSQFAGWKKLELYDRLYLTFPAKSLEHLTREYQRLCCECGPDGTCRCTAG
jgi:hypothetical protein